jgi:hypothetical protein
MLASDPLYVPTEQFVHRSDLELLVNVPGMHAVQTCAPATENRPAEQSEQVAPPDVAMNVPSGQSEQLTDSWGLYLPRGHSEQLVAPSNLPVEDPASQGKHEARAVSGEYVPVAHGAQKVLLTAL